MKAALYARYSTDKQSGASIDDQLRICKRIAERHGFTVSTKFSDAAISGGTTQRPGYQGMLVAARLRHFDVIVAEDTSRLWRNLAEQAPRLAELSDLGVHVITHDLDTRQESAGMLSAVLGASSESYRKEIGRRVRRGLEGLARRKKSTGGRAYGYLSATESPTGERSIHPERAEIVREIFKRYAAGETLRAIASDLNVRGIPSPGADWNRTQKTTDRKWRVSALHALLQNDLYSGRVIWNRSRWIRSAADSRTRRYVENPQSEWIVHDEPNLRIVNQELFDKVQRRFAERAKLFRPGSGGKAKYLLSGLLRCAECGGAYVISAHSPVRYGCATYRQAGPAACTNRLQVTAEIAETMVIESIRDRLLGPEAEAHALRTMRQLACGDAETSAPETTKLDVQIAELEKLRASGVLSPEIAGAALERAYRDRDTARRPNKAADPLLGAEREYRETVRAMREALGSEDIPTARDALQSMLEGPIRLQPRGGQLVAELVASAKTGMVAGVGFEPTTFGL
jgi:site-specific DNA recombinase